LNSYILQGNVETHPRCGGIYIDIFIANFTHSVLIKECSKSVNIWWRCGQEYSVSLFWLTM